MKKQLHCKALKRGFTLVELSIVLAIIGLLVGGIMGINTYVRSARLNGVMNDSKIYITAFNQFQTRYGSPPGDYSAASAAWTGAGNGDGNGVIRADAGAGNPAEYYYVFQHLALAGFIPGTYTGLANSVGGATAGQNVPAGSMEKTAYIFDHPDQLDGYVSALATTFYPSGMYGNVLIVAGLYTAATGIPNQPFLSPKQAYQLDDKFDDGVPTTGMVLIPGSGDLFAPLPGPGDPPLCTTSGAYNVTTDDKACYLILKFQ